MTRLIMRRWTSGALGLLVLAGGAVAFGAMQAGATPGAGIVGGPILARGAPAQDVVLGVPATTRVTRTVTVRVGRRTVRKRVTFTVPTVRPLATCAANGPCDIAFQQITIAPGGHTGWHTHPGPTFVAMAQGEGTLYHGVSGCLAHKYGVGTGFFQPTTEVHNFRNEGSTNLTLLAFYMLPAGTPSTGIRVDQPQPSSCPNIP
jgi:mannose-6-phosphate isomerase-like protein (cupin superfamily)